MSHYRELWIVIVMLVSLALGVSSQACGIDNAANHVTHAYSRRRPWNQIDFFQVETQLRTDKILKISSLAEYLHHHYGITVRNSNRIYIAELENGLLASVERDPRAEIQIGAYQLSRELGHNFVQPTVKRNIQLDESTMAHSDARIKEDLLGGPVLMRLYVKPSPSGLVHTRDASERDLFYFITGNWNRSAGTQTVDATGALAVHNFQAIATPSQARYGEKEFISQIPIQTSSQRPNHLWPKQFPFETAQTIAKPEKHTIFEMLLPYASSEEIRRFWSRIQKRDNRSFSFVVWRNQIWVQRLGYAEQPPLTIREISQETIDHYRELNLVMLRRFFPSFSDDQLQYILNRRDEILRNPPFRIVRAF